MRIEPISGTPIERLRKIRDKLIAWSAFEAMQMTEDGNKTSSKLDSIVRYLDKIIEEL